jgi:hypothetical protein
VTTVCDAERKKERKKERLSSAFDFEPLYERYPNKQGKAKGIAKLKALVKTEAEFQAVLRGLECFIRDEKRKGTETRFYPHFSTWVNGKRWEDYPAPAASEAVKGAEAHPAERRLTALEQIKLDEARERGLIP